MSPRGRRARDGAAAIDNWLLLDEPGLEAEAAIAFRWGSLRGQHYRLGEKIGWHRDRRPPAADGENLVPGLARRRDADGDGDPTPAYYLIRIIDDLIVSAAPAGEAEFARAETALAGPRLVP